METYNLNKPPKCDQPKLPKTVAQKPKIFHFIASVVEKVNYSNASAILMNAVFQIFLNSAEQLGFTRPEGEMSYQILSIIKINLATVVQKLNFNHESLITSKTWEKP